MRWLGAESAKDLSNFVFLVLTPALMFRAMGKADLRELDFLPLASYFAAVCLLFGAVLLWRGLNRRGAVLAMGVTFSDTVMIGIALIQLAYGEAGPVIPFAPLSVHALVLLAASNTVLKLGVAREAAARGRTPMRRTVLGAMRALIHPVPLPIIA
ncbi:MAG: AEC family transporter [Curvibacter sp.]